MVRMERRRPAGKAGGRARTVLERPQPAGWRTSDEDEIALRRWRGQTEILAIEALEPGYPLFGTFRVRSGSGGTATGCCWSRPVAPACWRCSTVMPRCWRSSGSGWPGATVPARSPSR